VDACVLERRLPAHTGPLDKVLHHFVQVQLALRPDIVRRAPERLRVG
jgi:hypothetical protein